MSEDPNAQIATLQQQIQDLQRQNVEGQLVQARLAVYAEHPHLRQYGLLEDFQGGPDQIAAFGAKLAEQFPAPPTPQPSAVPAPAPSETTATPTPAPNDMLQQGSADVMRANEIRDKMAQGLASRAEVLWLSQNAPRREVDLGNGLTGVSGGYASAVKALYSNNSG